jgi:hypothetical protein
VLQGDLQVDSKVGLREVGLQAAVLQVVDRREQVDQAVLKVMRRMTRSPALKL